MPNIKKGRPENGADKGEGAEDSGSLRVAIVQDYLHVYGGAEGVVNAIWELFPDSDIYSATYDAEVMKKAGILKGAKIHYPRWKDNIPGRFKKFVNRLLIANLPFYFQNLDLTKYDLIISSSAHFAKGARKTRKDQIHVSYIHTPPRFLYGLKGEIRKRSFWYWRVLLFPLDTFLRYIDQQFAKKPDFLLCNSKVVQERIKKIYKRDATIINPFPALKVSDEEFIEAKNIEGKYYLSLGRLAEYKHVDIIIKTCRENNLPLKVAGTGPNLDELKKLAQNYPSVEILGFVTDEQKKELYKNCIAGIYAVEDEDFGMAPLEPMLYGKPVIAYKSGGYLETIEEGKTGNFFDELTDENVYKAIEKSQTTNWKRDEIRAHALTYSKQNFQAKFMEFLRAHGIRI